MKASVGDTASFVMHVVAFPQASYTWYKDDGATVRAKQTDTPNSTGLEFENIQIRCKLLVLIYTVMSNSAVCVRFHEAA